MIELKNVSKTFADIAALHQVTAVMKEGQIFGLVGTNGAGKSTLLRLIAGVLRQDEGEILLDGKAVWNDPEVKAQICFLPDSGYYPVNATPLTLMKMYEIAYPSFEEERFLGLLAKLNLDPRRQVAAFSKGMKKQMFILLGLCAHTKYLLLDETFDGLDPVVRQAVKRLFAAEILDRDFVPIIASHNLREIEDICDHIGLLHRGGLLLSEDLDDMKLNMQKIQLVLSDPEEEKELLASLQVVLSEKRGSVLTLIARGQDEEVMEKVQAFQPVFAERLPLSLEEIFITETEVAGYDIRSQLS